MNPGGRGCSEARLCHCTPAWVTDRDTISKKKKKNWVGGNQGRETYRSKENDKTNNPNGMSESGLNWNNTIVKTYF